jgi:hypothetical protein
VRQHVDHVPEEDGAVGRGQRIRVVPVVLELAGAVLVVVRVVAPAEGVEVPRHGGQVVPHPRQALDLVTGLRGGVERVGDLQRPVLTAAQQAVLQLGAGLEHPAALLRELRELAAQDHARGVGPGLALDVRIAVQHRDARLPGQGRVGRRVRDDEHVRVGRRLPEVARGVAGEPGPAVHEQVERRERDGLRARLAVQVHEHRQEELDAVRLGAFPQVAACPVVSRVHAASPGRCGLRTIHARAERCQPRHGRPRTTRLLGHAP